jgi:hypothetical protein
MTAPENRQDDHQTVMVPALDRDEARTLIEELEDSGVPSTAIELDEPGSGALPQRKAGPVFGDVARAVLVAVVIGAVAGAALGLVVSSVTEIDSRIGVIAGAAFGGFIGVAVGGIWVVRYASPAWREASEAERPKMVRVTVRHPEQAVVDQAAEVIREHGYQPGPGSRT